MKSTAVYHGHKPLRIVLSVVGWIVMIALVVAIFCFFWFKRYIVYADDGTLRVEVPYLADTMPDDLPGEAGGES